MVIFLRGLCVEQQERLYHVPLQQGKRLYDELEQTYYSMSIQQNITVVSRGMIDG